ncbi:Glutathione S-transferase family protein [Quillaja saponaria]|uniref:glutathione transferase n=1 Tax=Quillaja saponaria TaxID=32244 RepID=A0AAD7QG67_QUISA|nr:Glutathione S-transferase family protein [Quillaja saponaria]
MAIKVYGIPTSTCTAHVLLCLHEKGIEYQLVPVDLASAAHKQQPHLPLNPFGQVPAIEDDDISLLESRAINRYLARKHKSNGTDLLQSNSLTESAMVDTWMEVEAHQFNGPISTIIYQTIVNPIYGLPPNDKIINSEMDKLEKVLDVYEERLSKYKFLAGDNYTMADLNHILFLVYFMRTPKAAAITSRPRVNAWWNDISSRPATIKVSEAMKV